MTTTPPEPPGPPSDGDDNLPPAPPSAPGGSSAAPPPPPPPPPPAGGSGYESPPPPPPPAGGYGAPPPQPGAPAGGGYGAPAGGGYGAPAGGGYGAPGGQPTGYPAGAAPAPGAYADWPKRVLSALIDSVGPFILAGLFYSFSRPLGSLLWLVALGWGLYNAYLGGETGQSYGKKIAGTRLLLETTGQPPGGGLGIGRYFVHIVDSLPCYLGYLWPLWDPKRQTFADKILKTVVVTA
jgi:uncharacterized RDD family membrane protein YckC